MRRGAGGGSLAVCATKDIMNSFSELSLLPEIHAALAAQGYERPTPIQAQAIPPALLGQDLLGIAQTGTGKTAAFTLPILQRLSTATGSIRSSGVRALILTPTRELAIQIGESIAGYGAGLNLRHAVIFGGVGQTPQVNALRRGLDILVATPGRLLDLMNQGHVRLDKLEVFVLDEADRMLDMGFIHDVRKVIAKLPKERQTLFFSATMPQEITDLAARLLKDAVRVEVTPVATTVERIDQRVIFVPAAEKRHLLLDLLCADAGMDRVMVFTRTKHGANKVAEHLAKAGVAVAAIHGNKSQGARQAALEGFRAGTVRVLVATDIAARGIDVDGVSHVVNFELPNIAESYVHRIGRTARAGASGTAIAFCDDGEERSYLRAIEKLTRKSLTVVGTPAPTRRPVSEASPVARPAPKRAPVQKRNEPRRRREDPSRAEQAPRKPAVQSREPVRASKAPPKAGAFSDLVSAINRPAAGGKGEHRR
jgi:ATP-dependent RNA helicase RhlE